MDALGATALLAIGLVTTCYVLFTGTVVNKESKLTMEAYMAAQQQIEILRNMPYITNPSGPGLVTITRNTSPEARFIRPDGSDDASRPDDPGYPGLVPALANLPGGSGSLVIVDDPVLGDQCKNITVTVRWNDRSDVVRSISVPTSIARGGVNPQ